MKPVVFRMIHSTRWDKRLL